MEGKAPESSGSPRQSSSVLEETMNLLSGVRLGVGLNLIQDVSVYTLNKLLVFSQPAHLAEQEGRVLSDPELPVRRASYVRTMLDSDAASKASDSNADE